MNKQKNNFMAGFAIIAVAVVGVLLASCQDVVRSLGMDVSTVKMGKASQELLVDGIPLTLYRVTADELFCKITKAEGDNAEIPFTATVKQTAKDAARVFFDLSVGTSTASFVGKKWGVEVCKKDESREYNCKTSVSDVQITPKAKIDDNVAGATILQTGIPVAIKNMKKENITVSVEGGNNIAGKLTFKMNNDLDKILVIPQAAGQTVSGETITVKVLYNGQEQDSQQITGVTVNSTADAYRHFTDKDGKDYVFGLVSQEHFTGTGWNTSPVKYERGSSSGGTDLVATTEHLATWKARAQAGNNTGNSLHITNVPSYDYMEFKIKDAGNMGITIRVNGKEWLYRDGKFRFRNGAESTYTVIQIQDSDTNIIRTTYNKDNNDYVVFGIWNGAFGSDAETSLLMECAGGFDSQKAECHFVYDNAGKENIGGSTVDFIVEVSGYGDASNAEKTKVEMDYIAFFKKQ